jgi:lactose/cellobiose-specific phosphotransferase system IIC component
MWSGMRRIVHNKVAGRIALWFGVIRDAFISLMPLTFLGLGALLLQYLPWDAYQEFMGGLMGVHWRNHFAFIIRATHGVFGMTLAVIVAVHLFRRLPSRATDGLIVPPVTVAISSLINFMLFTFDRPATIENLGQGATLLGIVVGIGSAELLSQLVRIRWLSMMRVPYESEANFYFSMRMTAPVIAAGLIMFMIAVLVAQLPPVSGHTLKPLVAWAQTHGDAAWWLSPIAATLNQLFWFLGINGGNMLDIYAMDFFPPLGASYTNSLASRTLFDNFVLLGGSGATAGLLVAIFFHVKQGPQRRIAQLSVVPGFFNINESVLYGLPLVLNSIYLIPFLLVPVVLSFMTLALAESGWFVFRVMDVPWTTPPLISGWLVTDSWRGALWQLAEIALSAALYSPFVRKAEAGRKQREAVAFGKAMKTIAANGQLRVPFSRRRDEVGLISRGLLADLRDDLESRTGALSLMYQAKHDRAGAVVGVEALLRWQHPRHGAISPAVFVALAEDSRDIHRLGAWVFDQACACKARWNTMGYGHLTMAVNVSPVQLTEAHLASHVAQVLQMHGLQAREIELEITESAVIPDTRAVDQTLQQLAQIGVLLAMDDFGMGYSSLLYLRRFPVSSIKIDGTLTRDVLNNSTNADIIKTIAALGCSQKAKIVAEFVETQVQRDALAELGCDIFQGYFHSAPLSELACLAYLDAHLVSGVERASSDALSTTLA